MADNFTTIMRWPGGEYAVISQTLAAFEHHHVMEIVGTTGAIRTWWSGAEDRTRSPSFELKVKRTGADRVETVELGASGELFELEEELCLVVDAFRNGKPIVSGAEARKRIFVCLEAERALAEDREIALDFSKGGNARIGQASRKLG
jgi:myo-inositol 2-dehydrogenase/D-chiro-inositol 1-dehydrogenase